MQHHWDEAYGYFTSEFDYPINGTDRFWGKYANGREAILGSATKIADAFRRGRAAIDNNDYATRDAQVTIINNEMEKVCAGTAIHYLNDAKASISDPTIKNHVLSEAVAFINGLRYGYNSANGISITAAEVDMALGYIGTDYNVVTISDINNVAFYKKINWDRKEDNDGWEFGGDWEYQINKNNSFKLRVVLTEENEDQNDISFLDDTIDFYNNSVETNIRKENERILRLSFNKLIGKSNALEYGIESAYNKLNRNFNLLYLDKNSVATNAGLINTSGLVEEDRYEGFLSYNIPLSKKIRTELALNYEWSEISQSGDINLSREFKYWKPRIDIKWDYKNNRQIRFNIERNVGQINFDNFISSYDQFEETIRAGNPDLKPETSWEVKLEHEWRLPNDGGVVTIKGLASKIDGPVDRLPIDGYAGIGNLGSGEKTQARIDGSIRINKLLEGGVFRFMGYLQSTEVNDPVTNIKRDFSWYKRWQTMIGLRQDVPGGKYSWGLTYRSQSQFNIYDPYLWGRFAQDPTLSFGFTAKINPRLNFNFIAKNILDTNFGFGRKLIYNGFKSNNDLLIQENFDINEHSFFKIELEGTF